MTEKWICLDCHFVGEITVHGECSKCFSKAVAIPQYLRDYFGAKDKFVQELERIFALEGRK